MSQVKRLIGARRLLRRCRRTIRKVGVYLALLQLFFTLGWTIYVVVLAAACCQGEGCRVQ
jgi:hypothetical protein